MVFNSLTFVLFFAFVLLGYHLLSSWSKKKSLLLLASYVFYGAWNPPFVLLLAFSTFIDWIVAARMARAENPRRRRQWLIVSLVSNLGLLGYFKYGGFILENFVTAMKQVGVEYNPAATDIILPVGISFYTFQTLSYTLDVYRKKLEPVPSILDFALFVSFFPQLVAGPIVRAADFLPQCKVERFIRIDRLGWGLFLLTLGIFQKAVLADSMFAPPAQQIFSTPVPTTALDTWIGVIGFSGQIFCDFAGYSTGAIGAALCLGFSLPDNFRSPYAAVGLRDFWRRWHISLSTWLRDYLYIPLGGSRYGKVRTALALSLTMLLGGLWHGAAWKFLIWGGLHGFFLIVERYLSGKFGHQTWIRTTLGQILLGILTYVFVCFTWVFFRADDLSQAMMHLSAMTGFTGLTGLTGLTEVNPVLKTVDIFKVMVTMAGLLLAHIMMRQRGFANVVERAPLWAVTVGWSVMLITIVLSQGEGDVFIYFQF